MKNKKKKVIEKINFHQMSADELKALYVKLSQEYRLLRFDRVLGSVSNLNAFNQLRKQIARISSFLKN